MSDTEEKLVQMTPEELHKLIEKEKKKAVVEAKKRERKVVEKQSKMQIADFMSISGLRDETFCKKLMSWHVHPDWARCLRESHDSLPRADLFAYMRVNYTKPSKKPR